MDSTALSQLTWNLIRLHVGSIVARIIYGPIYSRWTYLLMVVIIPEQHWKMGEQLKQKRIPQDWGTYLVMSRLSPRRIACT